MLLHPSPACMEPVTHSAGALIILYGGIFRLQYHSYLAH